MEVARQLPASERRKALVWLTTGIKFQDQQPKYELMLEALNRACVSVYPACSADIYDPPLALSTGGQTFSWYSFKGTVKVSSDWDAVQAALADFGPYYMLVVSAPTPKELDWIPVKIKVNRPGVTVRAAPGFLGLKPVKVSKGSAQP